jgi:lipoprotein NlpD
MNMRLSNTVLPVIIAVLVVGCASSPAPVTDRSSNPYRRATPAPAQIKGKSHYVVVKGDTLYSIAWRYGLDFRTLAGWNGIGSPFTIYPDQRLRLTRPPGGATPRPVASQTPAPRQATPKPQPAKPAAPPRTVVDAPANKPPATSSAPIKWRWPADGKVVASFVANDPSRKGVDIGGQTGAPVKASADGEVVYSGSGLIGYGELIIIKHDPHYLSAYAHNAKRLVGEGDQVKAGQQIAELGSSGTDRSKLHFEIRKDGNPVDPQRFLPKR